MYPYFSINGVTMLPADLLDFLLKAKRNTYASGKAPDLVSRPGSHDLSYEEAPFLYIDTYLGGFAFIGEEAVWYKGEPVWGMNYSGKMLIPEIPYGFSHFLKNALLLGSLEMPQRGPAEYTQGIFQYRCVVSGELDWFNGEEMILQNRDLIYRLYFHGGEVIA